ncbi:MAG: fibronectin type III domain-containing protein [Acidimicrobiales bacterium]
MGSAGCCRRVPAPVRLVVAAAFAVVLSWTAPTVGARSGWLGEALGVGPASAETLGTVTVYGNELSDVRDITSGPDGNLWIAAGTAIVRMTPDGTRTVFRTPPVEAFAITAGPDGNVWFRSGLNGSRRIGKITPTGAITLYADARIQPGYDIVAGPDGNLWFDSGDDTVGRISPAGTFAFFTDAAVGSITALAPGPDGNVWFASLTTPSSLGVGRIAPNGTFTVVPTGLDGFVEDMAPGPDGALWFTRSANRQLGRVTTAGQTTTVAVPTVPDMWGIVSGPDGNLWVSGSATLARVTTAGAATVFPLPPPTDPYATVAVAAGSDGNLWLAGSTDDWVRRVTTTGAVTTFADAPFGYVADTTAGPDGNVWFTEPAANRIGRLAPDGSSRAWYPVPGGVEPQQIITGPDGNLWFTTWFGKGVGRMTPSGAVAVFTNPALGACEDLTVGPDGQIWFACLNNVIGRVTLAGAITVFPAQGQQPDSIVTGPDGNLWYTSGFSRLVHRMTTAGAITTFDPGVATGRAEDIVVGSDGNLWVLLERTDDLGVLVRVTTAGATTTYALRPYGIDPTSLVAGPDGNLWMTDAYRSRIARVAPTAPVPVTYAHPALDQPLGISVGPDGALWFADRQWDDAGLLGRVALGGPGAPRGVQGVPGNGSVQVGWQAPLDDGGTPITGYTVTAAPGGATCSTTGALGCTVAGLTNGQPYTFTVRATNADGTGPASAPSPAVTPRTVPGAPTAVTALPGAGAVAVQWSPPASDGGSPITGYTVTASPGGATCAPVPPFTSCVVTGLTNGQAYAFTVRAANAAGTGSPSSASSSVTPTIPTTGPLFHPLDPARILDTRPGAGQAGLAGAFGPAQARQLQVTGRGGVPAGATAVVLNVTGVLPTAPTFLSITPTPPAPGTPITTSSLNLSPGTVRPNLVVAKLDGSGRLAIYNNSGTVDVLADVVGWFDDGTVAGDPLTSVSPARILDTRPGPDQRGLAGRFGPQQARVLQVTGVGGVPAGATAVVMNVTSVGPSADSFLTLTPDSLAPGQVPSTSNVNVAAGQVRPNLVVVKLDGSGRVTIYNNSGTVDVLADVVGYFTAGGGPAVAGATRTVTPARILDTRPGPEQVGAPGPLGPTGTTVLQVAGRGGVPAGATAVWMNVTSVSPTADSFLSVLPGSTLVGPPSTSNLNLAAGQVVPNLVLVKLDAAGRVTIYNNSGSVHVLADVVGYVT